jgi:archaetidylinositol phosphate synthase
MLTKHKPKLSPIISFVAKPFIKINPNILTLFGLLPPIFFFVFFVNKNYILSLLMFLGLSFDAIDGAVARMTGKISAFGGFLDSSLDRVADFLLISAFGFGGAVRFEIVCVVAFLSFLISYLRSRAEQAGKGEITLAVGIMERTERIAFLALAVIALRFFPQVKVFEQLNLAEIIFIVLGILSFITVLQRFFAAYKSLK